jgi:ATP/maltotriose-dependent transcriptional regulator MalT
MVARRRGDFDLARRHLRRSLDRAGVADRLWARISALNSLALLERAAGDLQAALALTDEALRRCVVAGDRHLEAALRNHRADLLHALGRLRESDEEQLRSVTAFAEVGGSGSEPEIWKLVEW